MKKSFAIIGPKRSQNTIDLHNEIEKRGHVCTIYAINDISVNTQNYALHPFFSHDIYLFRGYNRSIGFARSLATILHSLHKTVIDNILYTSTLSNKFQESILLKEKNIPQPPTYYACSSQQWEFVLKDVSFPLVVKPINGQQGQGIYKCFTVEEVLDVVRSDEKNFIAQEFLPADGDVRIFIVDQEILGAIKRFIIPGDFRSNASLGARTKIYHLSSQEKEIALAAHRALGYDVSGVDMIISHDKQYILEVNHTPQWQAFKKTTTLQPEPYIINFALHQYEKENRLQ